MYIMTSKMDQDKISRKKNRKIPTKNFMSSVKYEIVELLNQLNCTKKINTFPQKNQKPINLDGNISRTYLFLYVL